MNLSPFPYCWAVARPPAVLLGICAAVVALALLSASRTTVDADMFVFLLLVVQTFTVSTSFRGAALRGRFDPLLVAGCSRARLGLAHWTASAAPGIAAWLLVGIVLAADAGIWIAFQPKAVVALALASTVPWAVTFALPPFVGGAISVVVVLGLATSASGLELLKMAVGRAGNYGTSEVIQSIVLFALCPYLLPGSTTPGPGASPVVLLAGLAIAGAALAGPVYAVVAADYPLRPES